MEFKEAMRIWKRMCVAHTDCNDCPVTEYCFIGFGEQPEEVQAILANWAAEHPEKTIADDFFEKHPKAPRDDKGMPQSCARDCGYVDDCPETASMNDCEKCWRRPMEE